MLGGGQPIRVSTESVEYDIKRSEPGKARAVVYQEEGHYFYSLTLEYADATKKNWTLDFTTGVWHERSQTDILCVTTWGKKQTIVGRDGHEHIFDFRLDWGVIEDDTTGEGNISREAVGPIMFADFHRVTMKSFQVDIPARTGGDSDDSIKIEWSDDAKETWKGGSDQNGDEKSFNLDDGPRFRITRLGQFREGRNMRISTDAKRWVDILGAYVETNVKDD